MGSQGYGYSSSQSGFSSSKNERKPKTGILRVMPCTVSQLLAAREHRDSFFIRNMELNQVSVVGLIRRAEPTLTHLVYSLDDMTGPLLPVKQWLNLEEEIQEIVLGKDGLRDSDTTRNDRALSNYQDVNMNHCVIPPGTYVKVIGSLRSFQHHRSMMAFSIRHLDDFNEITSHMLEVIQAHLHSDSTMKNEVVTPSIKNTSDARDPATVSFTANQRQVFSLIKSCPLVEGISMQCLRNSLKYLSFYDLRTCLQFLVNEGHIFSTIDDYHFKSTYD